MSGKACCPLGRRADIGAISAALRAGMKVREVAKLYGVGKSVVGDHRSGCLKLDTEKLVPPASVPEVSKETPKEEPVRGQSGQGGQPSGAPRARPPTEASAAKSFVEQSLVCADMIAEGKWLGRPSVRFLSALWGLSADAVRDRHQAGVVAAAADRGRIEAERQVSIGAFQEQERIALEAFEASKSVLDEGGNPLFTAGEPKFLAVAQKARSEIAKIAGCVTPPPAVVVNLGADPAFAAAARRYVDAVQGVLGAAPQIAARLAETLPGASAALVSAVLAEAAVMLEERLAPPALPEAGA
jgi:hypothetical protein